jgi:bilirubin oxidase
MERGRPIPQVSKGLAAVIIVRDSLENSLNLPHTYGIDDIPVIVQTKAFDILQQIAISYRYGHRYYSLMAL